MGTRDHRIVRFRKRYYTKHNHYDSYLEGLGKELVDAIPTDPDEYQKWLEERREEALQWPLTLERCLCVGRERYKALVERIKEYRNQDRDDADSFARSDVRLRASDLGRMFTRLQEVVMKKAMTKTLVMMTLMMKTTVMKMYAMKTFLMKMVMIRHQRPEFQSCPSLLMSIFSLCSGQNTNK